MVINIRKVGEVADGSVTEAKLADGAVTNPKLADAAVYGDKVSADGITSIHLADDSVIESKIADDAVSTVKLADEAVTLEKASEAVRTDPFLGDETEVSTTGLTYISQKEFNFTKSSVRDVKELYVLADMKSSNASYTATLGIFIDTVEEASLTSIATSYELKQSSAIDISGLGNGKHKVEIKLKSSDNVGIAYNELLEVYQVK